MAVLEKNKPRELPEIIIEKLQLYGFTLKHVLFLKFYLIIIYLFICLFICIFHYVYDLLYVMVEIIFEFEYVLRLLNSIYK